MHVLIATATMDLSGTPTYAVTIGNGLRRLGEAVSFVTKAQGALGYSVGAVTSPKDTGSRPDIILAQHSSVVKWCQDAWRGVPVVFHHHGGPLTPDHCPRNVEMSGILSINHQCTEQMRRERITQEIHLMRDCVDMKVFREDTSPRETDKPRVLFISNYKKWRNWQRLSDACAELNLPLKCIGSPYGKTADVASYINKADIVVTWGRGVLEAASCGRPVISYDLELGDGYLTPTRFLDSRERNFSGYECRYSMGVNELISALKQYNPADGQRLKQIVAAEHNVESHVLELQKYLRKIACN